MNKICTSLEQSQKLVELGIDVSTADMYWLNRHIDLTETKYEVFVIDRSNEHIDFFNSYAVAVEKGEIIPAWSLSALMDLLPSNFTEVGKYATTTYQIDIRKYKLTDSVDLHQIAYGSYTFHEEGNCSWKDMVNTGEREDLLDAVFDMVCWLLENKKL